MSATGENPATRCLVRSGRRTPLAHRHEINAVDLELLEPISDLAETGFGTGFVAISARSTTNANRANCLDAYIETPLI